jgi:hypothetical protein
MKSYPDPAVMMTLSAIAYYTDIPGQLADTHYATGGIWSLTWGPVQDELGNLAYVAVNASTNAYALVIRGSETNFSFATLDNWFFDLDVLIQEDWPYFPDTPGARISNGAYLQASNLTSASSSGVTLATFLTEQVPSSATLYLTGHQPGRKPGQRARPLDFDSAWPGTWTTRSQYPRLHLRRVLRWQYDIRNRFRQTFSEQLAVLELSRYRAEGLGQLVGN